MYVSFFGLIVFALLAFAAVKTLLWLFSRDNVLGRIAIFLLLVFGMGFFAMVGVQRRTYMHVVPGEEIAVVSTPVPPAFDPVRPESRITLTAPHVDPSRQPQPQPQPPIEELWAQLTTPRINLDETAETAADAAVSTPSSRQELADAARVILSASIPSADPFTQGWLVNAAKAIAKATPTPNAQAASRTPPEWVTNPQSVVGSTASTDSTQLRYARRVVSTDPLKTLEECRDQLEKRLRYAVGEQVRALAKQATGGSFVSGGPMLSEMGVTPDFIVREYCPEGTYVETVEGRDGAMLRAHALLEFTPPKEQALLERWQTAMRAKGFGPDLSGLPPVQPSQFEVSASNGERPEWVVNPPKQVGNVRKYVVVSDPYYTADEGREQVDREMEELVLRRANELTGSLAMRSGIASLNQLRLGSDYVRRELCTDEYVEAVDSSFGEMKRVYALLEFNQVQDAILADRVHAFSRRAGLANVVLLGGGLLGGVATIFGLLKLDTWTRGYYTKRLFLGVPAAIITVLTLLFVS